MQTILSVIANIAEHSRIKIACGMGLLHTHLKLSYKRQSAHNTPKYTLKV